VDTGNLETDNVKELKEVSTTKAAYVLQISIGKLRAAEGSSVTYNRHLNAIGQRNTSFILAAPSVSFSFVYGSLYTNIEDT